MQCFSQFDYSSKEEIVYLLISFYQSLKLNTTESIEFHRLNLIRIFDDESTSLQSQQLSLLHHLVLNQSLNKDLELAHHCLIWINRKIDFDVGDKMVGELCFEYLSNLIACLNEEENNSDAIN